MPRTKKIQEQDNALELETAPKPEGEAAQQPKRRGRKPKAQVEAEKAESKEVQPQQEAPAPKKKEVPVFEQEFTPAYEHAQNAPVVDAIEAAERKQARELGIETNEKKGPNQEGGGQGPG